ncbi:MAG: ThuA domain-containing protein [Opitutaceae bacterium]|nr:ThuA domain-containing protein [Opitutaceae bacterium]
MRRYLLSLLVTLLSAGFAGAADTLPRILLYTRNGLTVDGKKGYVHDNIPNSIVAIRKLGAENGFAVDVSDSASVFTDTNLARYRALVFSNTNNEILDTGEQKAALQRFLHRGGGFVGIHSACGSMRSWPWFWAMLGGSFVRHPKIQEFTIHTVERGHPSTAHLPATWRWTDEFYFLRDMPADLKPLLAGDLTTLDDPKKPADETTRPLAWYHEFEGGRCWYTTLGHRKESYSDPIFVQHILGGIKWVLARPKT